MRITIRCKFWSAALLISLFAATSSTLGSYQIAWFSIDCGGGTVSGGGYTVSGSAGQPEGPADMSGGGYSVSGGFWIPPAAPPTCACGDLDHSGLVDLLDFATFAGCFGLASPSLDCPAALFACADLNGSGAVDLNDFSIFSSAFGLPPSGSPPDCQ